MEQYQLARRAVLGIETDAKTIGGGHGFWFYHWRGFV
jgi:hypothetical protein